MKKFLPVFLLSLLFFQCAGPKRAYKKSADDFTGSDRKIRVLLSDSFPEKLVFKVPVNIYYSPENTMSVSAGQTCEVKKSGNGIMISSGSKSVSGNSFQIEPDLYNDLLDFKGKKFRGSFSLQLYKGKIYLLNTLDIDDYLKSVIYSEMGVASKTEDYEALKAFAVCIRNYAIMKLKENGKLPFDVYSDKRDQVYSGFEAERFFTNRAVIDTRGLVLVYNNQPAKTFYFSSCGGYTENCDNVFNEKGIEYLKGVQDGHSANCSSSPSFSWEEIYTPDDIIKFLADGKYINRLDYEIENVSVKSRFRSGRVNELEIALNSDSGEKQIVLVGNRIRYILKSMKNKSLLKSTMFQVETEKTKNGIKKIIITGKGNGHGVGFCQWGAIGLSRNGSSYEDILSFYFPGTKLENL